MGESGRMVERRRARDARVNVQAFDVRVRRSRSSPTVNSRDADSVTPRGGQ